MVASQTENKKIVEVAPCYLKPPTFSACEAVRGFLGSFITSIKKKRSSSSSSPKAFISRLSGTIHKMSVQSTAVSEEKDSKIATAEVPSAAAATAVPEEDDLDDLDDLLDDFADDVLSKPPGAASGAASTGVGAAAVGAATENGGATKDNVSPFNTDMAGLLKDLQIEDPETKKQFEELVKQFETGKLDETSQIQEKGFDNVMKSTMERLKKSGETIDEQLKNDHTGSNPEALLEQLLGGLGGGSGDGGNLDMSKLLVEMLEQISSKEVLYEPMKSLNTGFPQYLKDNKEKLSKEEYDNYTEQYELTEKIIAIFESPGYSDDDKAKRENVNALLESLQELGQPPTELTGTMPEIPGLGDLGKADDPSFNFDDMDIPKDLEKNLEKELEENCKQQ